MSTTPGYISVVTLLDPYDAGDGPFVMANIVLMNFGVNSSSIKPSHVSFLSTYTPILAAIPGSTFDLFGVASLTGAAAYNKALSQQRAEQIHFEMLADGASKDQIKLETGCGSFDLGGKHIKEDFHDRAVIVNVMCPASSADQLVAFQSVWDADPLKLQTTPPD